MPDDPNNADLAAIEALKAKSAPNELAETHEA